jgi:hypothetical protein
MAFENRFYIAGVVNSNIKYAKTVNGDEYAWFAVRIENKLGAKSTENNQTQDIGLMVFNAKIIEYMRDVNMKRNDTVVAFGFVSAFKHEVKGEEFTGHGVNVTQLYVAKKKKDKTK